MPVNAGTVSLYNTDLLIIRFCVHCSLQSEQVREAASCYRMVNKSLRLSGKVDKLTRWYTGGDRYGIYSLAGKL